MPCFVLKRAWRFGCLRSFAFQWLDFGLCLCWQQNSVEFAAVDDNLAAVDTFVVDSAVVHIAAADTVAGIAVGNAAAAGIAAAAVGSTAVLGTAGTVAAAVDFVVVYSHPCRHDPLLWTACVRVPLYALQLPAQTPQESLAALALRVQQKFHPSSGVAGQTLRHPCPWFQVNIPSPLG